LLALVAGCAIDHQRPDDAGPLPSSDAGDAALSPDAWSALPDAWSPPPDAWSPPDAGFVTAAHPPLPIVPDQGGPRLTHPQIIVVTYADDPNRGVIEDHARWMVSSPWLTTVAGEYGVGAASLVGVVVRTEPSPDVIDDAEIRAALEADVSAGVLPRPPGGSLANAVYLFYFPRHTSVTEGIATSMLAHSCEQFLGYHYEGSVRGEPVAYAVIADCPPAADVTALESLEETAGHELVEAATDPMPVSHPAWAFGQMSLSPWLAVGPELADLCALRAGTTSHYFEGGFANARIWSNAAAARGDRDPCLPDTGAIYASIAIAPDTAQPVTAGGSVTFDIVGWSTGPAASWGLYAMGTSTGTFTPTADLSVTTSNNGERATLTVGAPPSTPSGSFGLVMVDVVRSASDYEAFPVLVYVP
jgi:hypothetical protein